MSSRIICFEGAGVIGVAIGGLTGSDMSHVAWQTPDGTLWEAVDSGFKRTPAKVVDGKIDWLSPLYAYHKPGTKVHVFEFKTPLSDEDESRALEFLQSIKDTPYGFRTLFAFMMRPQTDPEPDKIICSEAVLGTSIAARNPLQERLRPWQCSPRDVFISPVQKWMGSHTL